MFLEGKKDFRQFLLIGALPVLTQFHSLLLENKKSPSNRSKIQKKWVTQQSGTLTQEKSLVMLEHGKQ